MIQMHWVNKASLIFAVLIVLVYSSLWFIDRKNPEDGPSLNQVIDDDFNPVGKNQPVLSGLTGSKTSPINEDEELKLGEDTAANRFNQEEEGLRLEVEGETEINSSDIDENNGSGYDAQVEAQINKNLSGIEAEINDLQSSIERLEEEYNKYPSEEIANQIRRYNRRLEKLESVYEGTSDYVSESN